MSAMPAQGCLTAKQREEDPQCLLGVRRARTVRIHLSLLLAIAAVFAVLSPARAASLEAAGSAEQAILFFGDSLTAGYGLENPQAEAYPAIVGQKLKAENLPWRVVNAGLSGETTAAGLRRIDWVLRQPAGIVVLALGANDGLRGIDPAVTQQNLEKIIDRIRVKSPKARIVILGMQMPPGMGEPYGKAFRSVFPRVAEKKGATLLPFLLEGVGGRPDLNQLDGIHPTAAGHRIIAENVWKVLRPLL